MGEKGSFQLSYYPIFIHATYANLLLRFKVLKNSSPLVLPQAEWIWNGYSISITEILVIGLQEEIAPTLSYLLLPQNWDKRRRVESTYLRLILY